jgi:hypothetical protein
MHPGGGYIQVLCGNYEVKQWGAQENLWPKFILKSAPLRATSSVFLYCIPDANPKSLKINTPRRIRLSRNFYPIERFTSDGSSGAGGSS